MLHSKQTATISQEILWSVHFELRSEHNCDLTPVIFVGKTEGEQCASYRMPFVGARVTHQLQIHGWYSITIFIEACCKRAQTRIFEKDFPQKLNKCRDDWMYSYWLKKFTYEE